MTNYSNLLTRYILLWCLQTLLWQAARYLMYFYIKCMLITPPICEVRALHMLGRYSTTNLLLGFVLFLRNGLMQPRLASNLTVWLRMTLNFWWTCLHLWRVWLYNWFYALLEIELNTYMLVKYSTHWDTLLLFSYAASALNALLPSLKLFGVCLSRLP